MADARAQGLASARTGRPEEVIEPAETRQQHEQIQADEEECIGDK